MELLLQSFLFTPRTTISKLFVDGVFECYILEDCTREIPGVPAKEWKIPKQTAIPSGRYQVVLSRSTRFKKLLPELLNVPGYLGVRIHGGVTSEDTEGCLLTGTSYEGEKLLESQKAKLALMTKIANAAFEGEQVWITIERRQYYDTNSGTLGA